MSASFVGSRRPWNPASHPSLVSLLLLGALWFASPEAARAEVVLPDGTLADQGVLAESFGTDLGSNNGVHAYSNGSTSYISGQYLTTCGVSGMKWQCVEYSRRWLHDVSDLCFGSVSYAYQIWASITSATLGSGGTVPFDNYANGGSTPPQFGDLLVYNTSVGDGSGHVAVIVAVNLTSGYIRVAEQNWSNSSWGGNDYSRQLTLSSASGNYTVSGSGIYGWKRARVGSSPTSWLFNTAGNTEGWTAYNIEAQVVADGYWTINPGNDPKLISPLLSRTPSVYDYMKLGMKNRGTDENGRIYFSAPGLGYSESNSMAFSNVNDGGFNWISVPVGRTNNWSAASTIQYVRIDPVGNGSGGSDDVLTDYLFIREDVHAPYEPTIDSVSPSAWTNGAITVAFHSNDPEDVNPVGPDVYGSGVANFRYRIDAQSDQTKLPTSFNDRSGEASASITYSAGSMGSGTHTFHVYCWDNSGRVGPENTAILYYDGTSPNNPTTVSSGTHTTGVWSSDNTVSVSWSGASDAHSGVAGYSWSWTTSPSTVPDATQDGTGTSATSQALADGGSWYFHVRTRDNVGNWNSDAKHYGPFKIDTTAPTNPTTVASSSHVINQWSADNTVSVSWLGASDANSGVAGYSWIWTTSPSTVPDATQDGTGTSATSPALADGGSWYFHMRTRDNAGNWNSDAKHYGPFKIDTTAPTNPTAASSSSHTTGVCSSNAVVEVCWSGATDGSGSGVAGYAVSWSHAADDVPSGGIFAVSCTTSTELADGSWYVHVRAKDNVGLWASGAKHLGPFCIDRTGPGVVPGVHSTTHVAGTWTSTQVIGMAWEAASDGGAGIAGYSVLWSHQSSNTPDGTIDEVGLTTGTTLADGEWYFHIRAIDMVGNAGGVQSVGPFRIDHVPPAAVVDVPNGGEVWNIGGSRVVRWTATDDLSGVDSVAVWLSTDGGVSFPLLLGRVPGNADSLTWSVADVPTDSAMVRILVLDLAGNVSADTSDAAFAIALGTGVTEEAAVPAVVTLLGSAPSPLVGWGRIRFSVPVETRVVLRVYSVQGKLVRELVDGATVQPGFHAVSWDGRDDSGKRVASGVYLCRLEAAGRTATRRLVVLGR